MFKHSGFKQCLLFQLVQAIPPNPCCLLQEPIYNKVERMGGVTSRTFSEEVTHLVAGEVGSKKYVVCLSCFMLYMSLKFRKGEIVDVVLI